MRKTIHQRELRNNSGRIMKALDRGETFVVTRNGVPVGELRPMTRTHFVPAVDAVAAFATAPPIDRLRFRKDLDAVVNQDPRPDA